MPFSPENHIVVPNPQSGATQTWMRLINEAAQIDAAGKAHPEAADLASARLMRARMIKLADACEAVGRGEGELPISDRKETKVYKRRRCFFNLERQARILIQDMNQPEHGYYTRRIELQCYEGGAFLEMRNIPYAMILSTEYNEPEARPALNEAASHIRYALNELERLSNGDDALPMDIIIAVQASNMLYGDRNPVKKGKDDLDREAAIFLPTCWSKAFQVRVSNIRKKDMRFDPIEADRFPVTSRASLSHTSELIPEMILEPHGISSTMDVSDPVIRLRLLASLS